MKKNLTYLLLIFMLLSNIIYPQKYLDGIKVGDNFPETYNIGGWSVTNIKNDFTHDLKCKAFKLSYIKNINITPGLAYELEQRGGVLFSYLYFFINDDNIVVGIREIDIVKYAGSNGLLSFLNDKRRVKENMKYLKDWSFLDEFEYSNLNRYYAYTINNYTSSNEQVVKVISIKNNQFANETYLPNSKYNPLYIVGSPNQKEIKSTNQLILSKKYLYKLCEETISHNDKSKSKCDCFYEKAVDYLKKNKDLKVNDDILIEKLMSFLYECYEINNSN